MAALDDSKRATKLRGLLTRLKQGKTVQNRDLCTWLSDAAYEAYERDWAEQQSLRIDLKAKPGEIVEYERLLKSACFTFNKADALSSKGHSASALKMFGAADDAFECLHVYLAIALTRDGALAWWFDRDVYAAHGLTPDSVPRVITSKSLSNAAMHGGIGEYKLTKHQVKTNAVQRELDRLEAGTDEKNDDKAKALSERLKRTMDALED